MGCDNFSSCYPGAEEGVLVRRVPVLLLLLRSTEVRSSILHYDDVLTDHVTTSPLATQEQQLGVLVAGAGLRLDADSTPGCTSSIA